MIFGLLPFTEPPVWREWGLWSECSSSCGTGQRSRSRTCNAGQDCPNGDTCEGDSTETESCQDNPLGEYIKGLHASYYVILNKYEKCYDQASGNVTCRK